MRGLDGKVVLVTGGAGGIGAALCRRFAAEGCKLAVFDLDAAGAERVAREVGGRAWALDIADQAQVIDAVSAVERDLGPIDVLVNNAGWDRAGPFLETDTALFRDFAGEGERGAKLRGALERAIPFGRLGQPDDVVGAVVFLASDDAGFITGQVISASGGLTMAG